jgi:hypothetical protein
MSERPTGVSGTIRHLGLVASLMLTRACTPSSVPALGGDQGGGLERGPDESVSTCKAAKDPLRPLVVEWPGTAKADLEAASLADVVVVSYGGCTLKVLTNCAAGVGEQAYQLRNLTPTKERLEIDSEEKLAAELPLGFASLRGELQQGQSLSLSYLVVGQRQAVGEPTRLYGDCRGATHYVRTLTVGAYELLASAGQRAKGRAQAFGADATGSSKGRIRQLRGVGDMEECAGEPGAPGCQGILQLGLVELPRSLMQTTSATPQRTQSAGFGQGLGRLTAVPSVGKMAEFRRAQSLEEANPALIEQLELVQAAQRKEREVGASAEDKRVAWQNVANYPGRNDLRPQAAERAQAWGKVVLAQYAQIQQAVKVCDQQPKDKAKLDRLMEFDDDTVAPAQKFAYQREYDLAYKPFSAVLADCAGWRSKLTPEVVARLREQAVLGQLALMRRVGERLRDPRDTRPKARAIGLVSTEILGLERLLARTPKTSPDRPQLLWRLAEGYVELEAATRDNPKKVAAARAGAMRYFTTMMEDYPDYSKVDEVLAYLAYEHKRAGDTGMAQKLYYQLLQIADSPYAITAYLAFADWYIEAAMADSSKWDLAVAAYMEVTKYPPPANRAYCYATYCMGLVYTLQGKHADEQMRKAVECTQAYPLLPGAAEIRTAAEKALAEL